MENQVLEILIQMNERMEQGFAMVNERFSTVNEKFDKIDEKLNQIEFPLGVIEEKLTHFPSHQK